jgi:ABC-type nickel/cobalt efflux system permease component RcnA/Tol biopolymer transport system component
MLVCLTLLLGGFPQKAQAHAADQYLHEIAITVREDTLEVTWDFTPGPFLSGSVWTAADKNQNNVIEPEEQEAYLSVLLSQFTVQVGSRFLSGWEFTEIRWGETVESLSTVEDNIQFTVQTELPPQNGEVSRLQITNGFFPYYSITLFSLNSITQWLFSNIVQTNQLLTADLTMDPALGTSTWSSEAPDFSVFSGEQQRIPGTNQTIRERLNEVLMRAQDESGVLFTLGAIAVSLLLGMLHAFTPGHGKSVVAAYMIGAKGNWLQGITLGLIVSVTHTITVILVGLAVLFGSRLIQIESVFPVLEIFSALLILILGIVLFIQRYRFAQKARARKAAPPPEEIQEEGGETRVIIRQSVSEEAAPHPHIGPKYVPRHRADLSKLEWRTLLALGTSGGLVPCPDAVAIFIIAASLNLLQLGVFMIIAFSIGISAILMVLGALIARGKQTLEKIQGMQTIITHAPLISAAVLLVVGVFLNFSAFNRYRPLIAEAFTRPQEAVPFILEETTIAYLDTDDNGITQIYTMGSDGSGSVQRTFFNQNVNSFILAPATDVLFFTTFDQALNASQIWSLDLKSEALQVRIQDVNASIYNMSLTPDHAKVLFERTDLGDATTPYLITNIYQWDLETDETSPILSNTNLISFHPAFSPDQSLFTYFNPNANRYEIYAVDGTTQFSIPTQIGQLLQWSQADPDYVLYQDVTGEGKDFALNTYLYHLSTRSVRNLSEETGLSLTHALWVPEEFAVFLVGRTDTDEPGSHIYHYDLDQKFLTELRQYQPSLPRDFVASPDGSSLLYEQYGIEDRETYSGIWRLDRDGTSLQLNASGREALWLVWAP